MTQATYFSFQASSGVYRCISIKNIDDEEPNGANISREVPHCETSMESTSEWNSEDSQTRYILACSTKNVTETLRLVQSLVAQKFKVGQGINFNENI
ncbi:hypothetical protein MLD38_034263 [Melastoma candidum]|uniref:Uncharacterized protein n=1 Tax=Melastoma candidum TaxID=119954 RepID=A0ACB9M958_9MYRT|nr:hypothetical protein MLD38_034263 [Melastoma candidum]